MASAVGGSSYTTGLGAPAGTTAGLRSGAGAVVISW